MGENNKNIPYRTAKFSKEVPVLKVSSKQSQAQTINITVPTRPKESKKE